MLNSVDLGKINKLLLFIILISIILYFGKQFFILITFSGFLAMLMTPVSNLMEKHHISRIFSSIISVLIVVLVIAAVVFLLSAQISNIIQDFPKIKAKSEELIYNIQSWISSQFGLSSKEQMNTLRDQASNAMNKAGNVITGTLTGIFSFVGGFMLVLVFMFLFLLHREKYENFVIMFFRGEKRNEVQKIIHSVAKIAQQYLAGRLISIAILTVLYMIGFSLIGLKNAFLLSAIAAVVTFIPYVGPFIGGFVPFFMALINGSVNLAIWVVVIISLAQIFQNYFVEPYVVGGSVNISPLFTILVLILGGVVWGIAGIILFLPLLGVAKIIFENVEKLYPYAYLIGDQKDSSAPEKIWSKFKNLFKGKGNQHK